MMQLRRELHLAGWEEFFHCLLDFNGDLGLLSADSFVNFSRNVSDVCERMVQNCRGEMRRFDVKRDNILFGRQSRRLASSPW